MKDDEPLDIQIYSLNIEELIEKSFAKASEAADKENVSGLRPIVKARIKEKARLRATTNHLLRPLSRLQSKVPAWSKLTPFYRDLLSALGAEELEESRRAINRTIRNIRRLNRQYLSKIDRAKTPASIHAVRRAAYGRISSEARSLVPTLGYLSEISPRLRELPTIRSELPTLVIAGYPNVGKTTLLKALTGSAPEIRPIPFTTQKIQLGYYSSGWTKIQVIDTPGLLDRPLEKRNPVEMKALGAIKHLADVIVYIIDPTTRSGFPLEDQLGLLDQVKDSFSVPVVVAINKIDIAEAKEIRDARCSMGVAPAVVGISSTTQEGIENLRELVSSYLKESKTQLEG